MSAVSVWLWQLTEIRSIIYLEQVYHVKGQAFCSKMFKGVQCLPHVKSCITKLPIDELKSNKTDIF